MKPSTSSTGLDSQLTDLCRLVKERAPDEVEIVACYEEAKREIQARRTATEKQISQKYEQDKTATETEYASIRRRAIAQFDQDYRSTEKDYQRIRAKNITQSKVDENAARDICKDTRWEASTVAEAVRNGAMLELRESKARVAALNGQLMAVGQQAVGLMQRRRQWREYPDPELPDGVASTSNPIQRLGQLATESQQRLQTLTDLRLPRLLEGPQPVGFFLLLCLGIVLPTAWFTGIEQWPWIAVSGGVAVALFCLLIGWLYHVARRQSTEAFLSLKETISEAEVIYPMAADEVDSHYRRTVNDAAEKYRVQSQQAEEQLLQTLDQVEQAKQDAENKAEETYPMRLTETTVRRDRELENAEKDYSKRLTEIYQTYRSEADRIEQEHARAMLENDQLYQHDWKELTDRWQSGLHRFGSTLDEVNRWSDAQFPDWNSSDWDRWHTASEIPPLFRFGHYDVALEKIANGIPADERLQPRQTQFKLPALLPFPERSLLLLKASGEGRDRAIERIQSVMLRMLTAIPPGKVQFTIIDPVGLGENFSAFMHLADFDDKLVTSRIWTDPAHIDQRLSDLTGHMENVLQVYLRNEFETIQEYNDFAGEMAEAYRVLVVANFPVNISENAAQRLKSIVASGARCGVFTLMCVDTKLPPPRNFDLSDLLPDAITLSWQNDTFVTKHPEYGTLPLVEHAPPATEKFTQMVRAVGANVKDASKVEVPFEFVAPEPDDYWTADSREGIDVPLGRAGAKKLQHLNLGKGTSQHVLISGKTGSGKSTLLHALITNLALRYSPEEIQLYLVDFKKGVEFKAYGGDRLPHAKVVAIESEREFGLSVLARLDEELKQRGDTFRRMGVQDIKGYRTELPDEKLPRILLIIDEFQELFVEDDRLAQDAGLFLDRLVRQGRAFGIHVLLGSQTLAGAYSLARSTIGQMAVRIALQCSESDAHLILSEENTAARLLTRPGEAIYNDANGLFEGNHPFQVVWLPDHRRNEYLERLNTLLVERGLDFQPPIVFEGNTPANPNDNPLLGKLLEQSRWPEASPSAVAWLGAPVAIKDPTCATFVRQTGSNLLVVGHREEAALGVLGGALVSLAGRHPPTGESNGSSGAKFYIFDGIRPDAPEAGLWNRLADSLPHEVQVVSPRNAPPAMDEIAKEFARREAENIEDAPPIYFIVYHLGRFRDFRKADDDFGFSRMDEDKPANPAQQLGDLLRSGPPLGIHGILWCDTYNSVNRSIDRHGLRDIEMRVLFQMNSSDSSSLIDSPAAARLGVHRAILYDEGQGHIEKFRPYGVPTDAWLSQVKRQLTDRTAEDRNRVTT